MIAEDRFVFIHLHKSGGSFVNEFLLRHFPTARRIGYHYPLPVVPEQYRGLPVLSSVRNPWDAYVSYYVFQMGLVNRARERNEAMSAEQMGAFIAAGNDPWNGIDVIFEQLSEGASLGFAATTRRLLCLGADGGLLDRILDKMPPAYNLRGRDTPIQQDGFRGMNVRRQDLSTIRGTGEGLFSFLFRHMHEGGRDIHFLRMERLREDLLEWLRAMNIPVTPEMDHHIRQSERVNATSHQPYPTYYDADLARLVRERDAALIDRFGYRFEGEGGLPA